MGRIRESYRFCCSTSWTRSFATLFITMFLLSSGKIHSFNSIRWLNPIRCLIALNPILVELASKKGMISRFKSLSLSREEIEFCFKLNTSMLYPKKQNFLCNPGGSRKHLAYSFSCFKNISYFWSTFFASSCPLEFFLSNGSFLNLLCFESEMSCTECQ